MAESDPHPSDEELISAYCDGELRGAELARAEELLANRPECRQLLEEYRALRSRLREVPQRTLGGDFAERVLRRAERDMLVTAAPAESLAIAASAQSKKSSHWPQGRRPWVYVAMAAAAAIIIMLVESKDLTRERLHELARHEPLPKDAEMSAPAATDAAGVKRPGNAGPASRAPVDGIAPSAAPAHAPRQAAAAPPPASSSLGLAAAKDGQNQTLGYDMDVKRVLDELGWPAISQQIAQQAATVEQQQGGSMLPSDVLVVECNIAPQNRTPDPMVASFLDNSIAVDARSTVVEDRLAKAPAPPTKADDRVMGNNAIPPDISSQQAVELFYVVATPDQLEATLTDLGNRPGVSVNRLAVNRLNRAGGGGQDKRAAGIPRPDADAETENAAAPAGKLESEATTKQSQPPPSSVVSQQSRAQRLDIPENLRRLVDISPSQVQQDKFGTENKRGVDQKQPPPALRTAVPEQKLGERAKSTATAVPSTPAAEQAPLQRALFIVRVRPPAK